VDTSTWPGAEAIPRGRDSAQRFSDALYPLYQRMVSRPAGVIAAVALFGLVLPILILRQSWDVRWRVGLSLLVGWIWLAIAGAIL
jgi:hypothetical protein